MKKIAIIGSGISGLTSSLILSKNFKITLFEKNDYFGGHTNTIEIKNKKNDIFSLDTGFIVYNEKNYPNFVKLLNFLKVNSIESNMSFSVNVPKSKMEYSGSFLGIITNLNNFLNKDYYLMLKDIFKFYKFGYSYLNCKYEQETLENYIKRCNFSEGFLKFHLLPMTSSIWSSPNNEITQFPIKQLLNFYRNHQLLNFFIRPKWRTISDGSKNYVEKIISKLKKNAKNKLYLNTKIVNLQKESSKLILYEKDGRKFVFDYVIFANHTDEISKIIFNLDKKISLKINKFRYQKNIAYVHTDKKFMPKRKLNWSSWNHLNYKNQSAVTYWMNKLQNLKTQKNIFITLNPMVMPSKDSIIKKIEYSHPIYNIDSFTVQKYIKNIQGKNNLFFTGAWTGDGFHEDGVTSALELARYFKIKNIF